MFRFAHQKHLQDFPANPLTIVGIEEGQVFPESRRRPVDAKQFHPLGRHFDLGEAGIQPPRSDAGDKRRLIQRGYGVPEDLSGRDRDHQWDHPDKCSCLAEVAPVRRVDRRSARSVYPVRPPRLGDVRTQRSRLLRLVSPWEARAVKKGTPDTAPPPEPPARGLQNSTGRRSLSGTGQRAASVDSRAGKAQVAGFLGSSNTPEGVRSSCQSTV